jgi:methionyl-tRNA formyltransferase
MRIVVWIGNEPNQCALANKINDHFNLVGVVKESRQVKRKFTIKKVVEKLIEKIFLGKIDKAWLNMQATMQKSYPNYPDVPTINIENVNSEEVYNFTNEQNPDLIIVSGTRLVKERLLSLQPSIGILNLHTGLSPYIKGGPNCTNWCIATNQFHKIGNTIMWIDLGIDTGNLITTKCVDFTGNEDLNEVHLKVMKEAHDLYIEAIKFLENGKKQSVPQKEIALGKTYFTKDWNLIQKFNLEKNLKNWKTEIKKSNCKRMEEGIQQIEIN